MLKLYQTKRRLRLWEDSLLIRYSLPYKQKPFIKIVLKNHYSGVKIALDPGHIAGDFEMAETEGKYMKMHSSPQTDLKPIEFFEANLALGTAHIIRERLEEMGAEVLMTRTQPNTGALGLEFNDWKRIWFDQLLQEEIINKKLD